MTGQTLEETLHANIKQSLRTLTAQRQSALTPFTVQVRENNDDLIFYDGEKVFIPPTALNLRCREDWTFFYGSTAGMVWQSQANSFVAALLDKEKWTGTDLERYGFWMRFGSTYSGLAVMHRKESPGVAMRFAQTLLRGSRKEGNLDSIAKMYAAKFYHAWQDGRCSEAVKLYSADDLHEWVRPIDAEFYVHARRWEGKER